LLIVRGLGQMPQELAVDYPVRELWDDDKHSFDSLLSHKWRNVTEACNLRDVSNLKRKWFGVRYHLWKYLVVYYLLRQVIDHHRQVA
jgi:hypothetical protein